MYRARMQKGKDKKFFTKSAKKTNMKNYRIDRGGIRL